MTRLQSELHRLYFLPADVSSAAEAPAWIDADGRVRALVLELARPADWDALSAAWKGVQRDLELPAPGIAVSGLEGCQLWFSLAQAVPVAEAHAFLQGVRRRYLPEVATHRLNLLPSSGTGGPQRRPDALAVPSCRETGNWSAFVAPDLAPVFADTPWLDIPPGEEGQAELLRGLRSIVPREWQAALVQLSPAASTPPAVPGEARTEALTSAAGTSPREFLLKVMNDDSVPLALRIEAARALLPHEPGRPPAQDR